MEYKTWNEFWGEFLQVRFHAGNPDLWDSRKRKAVWFVKNAKLTGRSKILDLGCGDGLIDIWLSRMGHDVTAVDRNQVVLDRARDSDETGRVNFLVSELQNIEFPGHSFDAILLIETLGLMSESDDKVLLEKCKKWLKPGGKLVVDCPEKVDLKNAWTKEFPEGVVRGESSFDPETRLQNIQFYFEPIGMEEFGLQDPYDLEKGSGPGIDRYLYPKERIRSILENLGFSVENSDHYYEQNYFSLVATFEKT